MIPELTALLDQLASGLLEVRRQLCIPGSLFIAERASAAEHVKVAYAAIVNLRRILRRAEHRTLDAAPVAQSSLMAPVEGEADLGSHLNPELSHGPTAAEWRATHEEIKGTDMLWRSLAFDGLQSDGCGGLIEYRRCPHCGSTLGRRISRQEAIEVCKISAEVHARSLEALAHAPPIIQRRKAARRG